MFVSSPGSDCTDLQSQGVTKDGVYIIYTGHTTASVYCDMSTSLGGWTVGDNSSAVRCFEIGISGYLAIYDWFSAGTALAQEGS